MNKILKYLIPLNEHGCSLVSSAKTNANEKVKSKASKHGHLNDTNELQVCGWKPSERCRM